LAASPDSFFAVGDKGTDISAKIDRASRNDGRSNKFRAGR
jgi:hypothetical protein